MIWQNQMSDIVQRYRDSMQPDLMATYQQARGAVPGIAAMPIAQRQDNGPAPPSLTASFGDILKGLGAIGQNTKKKKVLNMLQDSGPMGDSPYSTPGDYA